MEAETQVDGAAAQQEQTEAAPPMQNGEEALPAPDTEVPEAAEAPQAAKRVSIDKGEMKKKREEEEDEEEEEEEDGEDMSFLRNRSKKGMLLMLDKKPEPEAAKPIVEANAEQAVSIELVKKEEKGEAASAEAQPAVCPTTEPQEEGPRAGDAPMEEESKEAVQPVPVETAPTAESAEQQEQQTPETVTAAAAAPEDQIDAKPTDEGLTSKVVKEYHTKTVKVESHSSASSAEASQMAKEMMDKLESDMSNLRRTAEEVVASGAQKGETNAEKKPEETEKAIPIPIKIESKQEGSKPSGQGDIPIKIEQPATAKPAAAQGDTPIPIKVEPVTGQQSAAAFQQQSSTVLTPTSVQMTMSPGTTTKKTISRTETKKTYITKKQESSSGWIQQESVSKNNWISGAPWTRAAKPTSDGQQPVSPVPEAKQFFQKTMTTRTERFSSDGQSAPQHWVTESKQVVTDGSPQPTTLQDFTKRFEAMQTEQQQQVPKQQPPQQQQSPWRTTTEPEAPPTTLEDFKKRFEEPMNQSSQYSYSTTKQQWSNSSRSTATPTPPPKGGGTSYASDVYRQTTSQQQPPAAHPQSPGGAQYSYVSNQQWSSNGQSAAPRFAEASPRPQYQPAPAASMPNASPYQRVYKQTTTYQRTQTQGPFQGPTASTGGATFGQAPADQLHDSSVPTGPFGRMPISRTVASNWASKVSQQTTSGQPVPQRQDFGHPQTTQWVQEQQQPTAQQEHHWSVSSTKRHYTTTNQQ